jgi:hypothetical protein
MVRIGASNAQPATTENTIAYVDKQWIIIAGTNLMYSPDTVTWTNSTPSFFEHGDLHSFNNGYPNALHFAQNQLIAVGNHGVIVGASMLEIRPRLHLERTASGLLLVLHGQPGASYVIERTHDLVNPSWLEVEAMTLSGDRHEIPTAIPNTDTFWRARKQ